MDMIPIEADDKTLPDGKTPLRDISEYSPVDVLSAPAAVTKHQAGNNRWRALVLANQRLYICLPKHQRVLVARSIVHAIRSQTKPHGGRFLKRDAETGLWGDIGDKKAMQKTRQALCDGSPAIKYAMAVEQQSGSAIQALSDGEVNRADPPGEDLNNYAGNNAMALGAGRGEYKFGKILPNGLIALNYEGVQTAMALFHRKKAADGAKHRLASRLSKVARSARGLQRDGTIDIDHSHPPEEKFSGAVQQMGMPRREVNECLQDSQGRDPAVSVGAEKDGPVVRRGGCLSHDGRKKRRKSEQGRADAASARPILDMVSTNHAE